MCGVGHETDYRDEAGLEKEIAGLRVSVSLCFGEDLKGQ